MINEYRLNKLIIFLFLFAPFISLIIYNFVQIKFIVILPQLLREILILFIVFLYFFHKGFWRKYKFLGILLVILFLIIFFDIIIYYPSYANIDFDFILKGILNNIRRFIFLFVMLIYFLYIIKPKNYYLYMKLIFKYLYIFWIFGLITYFLPLDFWYMLKLNYYWADVVNQISGNGATFIRPFEQSGKMFTHDTYYILGFKAKRLISFYLEPTTTASLAIASLFLSYIYKKRFLFYITLISGILTFSKAFYLFSIVFFGYIFLSKLSRKLLKIYNFLILVGLIFSIFVLYVIYIRYPYLFEFGFFAHLKGLYNYISNFNPIGYGIGLSGSFSIIDNPLEIGIESSFANIASQLGLFGIFIVFFYFLWVYRKLNNSILFLIIIFYFFIYLTSNSATGYSGNFLIIFIFAYFLKLEQFCYKR